MSVIEIAPGTSEILETEEGFENSFELSIPCECADLHGAADGSGDQSCPDEASWRVVMDCDHIPRHSYNYCDFCKDNAIDRYAVFEVIAL